MNLVADAMNLAGCAIGGGDSDVFSRALGADYHFTTSVGEFALGSRPETIPLPEEDPHGSVTVVWVENQ